MMRHRRVLIGMHVGAGFLLAALIIYPIRSTPIKLLIMASAAAVYFGGFLWIRKRNGRALLTLVPLLVGILIWLLPAARTEQSELRNEFVNALLRYRGVRYVWGGENGRGVDCSGIIRAAWIASQFRLSVKSHNSKLMRNAASVWWFDASAQEIGAGFGGRTRELSRAKSIRTNGDENLQPGDIAVVANGVHALAYLGNHTWIEADPGARKVITITTTGSSPWLDSAVIFVRWRDLD